MSTQDIPQVRLAVVGLGRQGRRHCHTARRDQNVELVATVDPTVSADAAEGVTHVSSLAQLSALAGGPPDAVIVATPPETHVAVGTEALRAGYATMVEKPLAPTGPDAELLVHAAELALRPLFVGHVERFNPAVQLVRAMLEAGTLGRPIAMSFRRVGLPPASTPKINVVHDLAVHDIDVFSVLAGRPDLTAASRWPSIGLVESAFLLLQSGDVAATIDVNWRTPVRVRQFTVTTDECYVEVNYTSQSVEVVRATAVAEFDDFAEFRSHYGTAHRTALELRPAEPLAEQLSAFVRALRGQPDHGLATGQDGVRAVAIADAASSE